MNIPGVDRLGLGALVRDHYNTLYRLDDKGHRRPRRADGAIMIGLPVLVAVATIFFDWRLYDPVPLLSGAAILTGALFTLLVTIFGISVNAKDAINDRIRVRQLVMETRANAAYATAWALALVAVLMAVQAFRAPSCSGGASDPLPRLLSALLVGMLVHLALTLLMVLNRIRLAFSELTN